MHTISTYIHARLHTYTHKKNQTKAELLERGCTDLKEREIISRENSARLEQERDDLAANLRAVQQELSAMDSNMQALKLELTDKDREKDALKDEVSSLLGALNRAALSVEDLCTKEDALKRDIEEVRRERDEFRATVEQHLTTLGELREERNVLRADIKHLEGKARELEEERDAALAAEKDAVKARERDAVVMEQELAFARSREGELQGREGDFRRQLDVFRRQAEESEEALRGECDAKIADLKNRLREAEDKIRCVVCVFFFLFFCGVFVCLGMLCIMMYALCVCVSVI
jgi:chromosome segregation ATPase